MVSAMRQSRFEGTARYLWAKGWKLLLPGAVAIFVMELLIYLMPALGLGTAEQGVSTVFWYVSVCALILMYRAANVDARFLITRLTPRPSVYAGVVLEILTFTALGVLLAAAVTLAETGLVAALSGLAPGRYSVSMWDLLGQARATATGEVAGFLVPYTGRFFLSTVEYCCFYYLYFCLLRRWKVQTLAVTIGVPVLMVVLVVVPAVNGFFDQIASMSEQELWQSMPVLMNLLRFMEEAVRFMIERWPVIRAVAAVACLALSYPVMAGTPQPK